MKLGKSQYTFIYKWQVFQTQPQCSLKISPFQAQMFLKFSFFNLFHEAQISQVFKLTILKQMEILHNHSKK